MIRLTQVSLVAAAFLTACGGGSGGAADGDDSHATGGSCNPGTTVVQPVPINPYTGETAPGSTTTTVTGDVFNSGATTNASVTAYLVNADGSNGAAIGTATTDRDGTFIMTLSQAPFATANYVRFIATGGTYTSTADHTSQTNGALELVTPYITTAFNHFVMTPLTNVASQRMRQVASVGGALAKGYTAGASMVLSLIGFSDPILPNNKVSGGVDYLGLLPGSPDDTLNAYADALNAIEAYGVEYDLPSTISVQLLTQSQLTGTASATLPGGTPINIGQWQGEIFDSSAPYTLPMLESTGAPPPYAEMHQFMMWEYAYVACLSLDSTAHYARFPLQQGSPDMFADGACSTYQSYVSKIGAKVLTNNRSARLVHSVGYVPQIVPVVGAGT
ncbi:hypothetical protein J8I87_42365 [Paraburkholderia sp. LEh10]|uniref:hypothetical protein n=1 Tax=Paraburkholderia sp. LEh10 TaxID=2821353 RepID=UPI001AE74FAB|nr:hypothetical protein [Paraburkholderia sp. LEh10]MBP0596130.1 hypothetical protein [Paraburkholderia sp. LEh10]MBP0596135.1 hypothetical protein [Paraburkholderia sp. LEh10]